MVHDAEDWGFKHLSLDQRTFNDDDRLVRKYDFTLAHGIYGSCELHCGKVTAEFCIFFTREEFLEECGLHVSEVSYHLDDFFRSAHHSPVVVFRSLPVEHVEDSVLILHSAVIEGLSHSVLVLVRTICMVQHSVSLFKSVKFNDFCSTFS